MSNTVIVSGAHSLEEETLKRNVIESITIHENYNKDTLDNDIALLKLANPVELSDKVQIICLPLASDNSDITGEEVIIVGWY